ncbi:MAG: hypothetical protein GF308_02355 [Candidatus Heimdallarchaeota archaeon]|nr:hypothetical protein [Candidatus Heimdallarchaeota archaeon]
MLKKVVKLITEKKRPEIKEIVDDLLKGNIYDRREAVKKLEKIGDRRVIAPIIQVLKEEEDFWTRWRAAEVLGKIKAEKALPQLLLSLTTDPNEIVRVYAAWAIGQIADEQIVPELKKASQKEKSTKVIAEIKKAVLFLQRKTKEE